MFQLLLVVRCTSGRRRGTHAKQEVPLDGRAGDRQEGYPSKRIKIAVRNPSNIDQKTAHIR
jgi:hypothetical protein